MTNSESPPIRCTLGSGDFKDRIDWIRELSARSLRRHRRDGLMLELTYDTSAAADVHDLVRREQACCSFLRFDVRESADVLRLTIAAPPEAQSAADELFATCCRPCRSISLPRSPKSPAVSRLSGSRRAWLSLALFALLLTRIDAAFAGRAYAAYGGVYITASLLWL